MTINCISESVNYFCKITHRDPGHGYIMQETVQLAEHSKQRGSKSKQVWTGTEEVKEIQTIPMKILFLKLHLNGRERNYNPNLMILNLYLIYLATIAGQYCTWEGVFLKAEKFAYDTKMRYWTVSWR